MLFKKRKNEKLILEQIYSKTRLIRYSQFIIGLLLVSVAFNAFILPNDIVYGVSGIGVILNKTLNISPSLVILIGGIALLILSFIYYTVRVFLENDAMIKAEFIAKEYMEKQPKAIEQEINEVVNGFKQLNRGCIKGTNCSLFINIMIKFVIFSVLALIF